MPKNSSRERLSSWISKNVLGKTSFIVKSYCTRSNRKTNYLNDIYMIYGRDPNGYVGILWSIAGVHNRPWFGKDIIGLIRPMSTNGVLKKANYL